MRNKISRRSWIQAASAAAASAIFPSQPIVAATSTPEVLETKVISPDVRFYVGWPTIVRRAGGQLIVVYSGGREAHICPFGRVEMMTSDDEGETWTYPRVLLDGALDDRDAGVLETARGTLLVTTFTSTAYATILTNAKNQNWQPTKLARWQAAHARLADEARTRELGVWMIRSTDGGLTWSERYDSVVNCPHGPVQLSDGRLLNAGKDLWRPGKRVGVCESSDDGQTWRWLADIPVRDGDRAADYHELHAVETADGRILAHIRNHNEANKGETLQSESKDGGKTWSKPRSIGVWGLPSHLLRLRDGRLLMSYSHRRDPLGNQARISRDHGRTWSDPVTISQDGLTTDLGYPSTVELDDGTLLTVWYEVMKGSSAAVLRQAKWRLTDDHR